jgi:prepilin peptidase CpaA
MGHERSSVVVLYARPKRRGLLRRHTDEYIMTSFHLIALGFAVVAAGWDVATRRIPNALTFGAALAAFAAHAWIGGWPGAAMALAGWAAGVALFFPVFALGGMGAGDVKLLGAVGAWLGPLAAVWVALYSGIAGGLLGVIVALCSGYLGQAITNVWSLLMYWRIFGIKPAPALTLSTHRGPRLAYAVPVLAGLMVTVWLQ